jgi:diketogulonate reductase-like aldo/keto reductase
MGDGASKPLGHTDVLLPEIGLGTWNYHGGPAPLRKGLEAGALFIDTADSYGNEVVVGEAVRGIRNSVFIATKVSPQNFRREALKRSAESSLQKLGVDCIDLLQLHEPNQGISIEETMGAMVELVEAGKIRFIGVSNFSIDQIEKALKVLGDHRIVSNQVRYSLIDRTIEAGLLQYCQANQITVIAYSPLGREFPRVSDCDPDGVIGQIASITGKTRAQIILNWCLCKERVVAIPKGNSEGHILENCGASGWRLSPEHLALLDSQIQFRRRSRFDKLVREWMPGPLRALAVHAVGVLPRGMRRRVQ